MQLQVQSNDDGSNVFLAVDALVSKEFTKAICEGQDTLDAIIVSNNSQIVPDGAKHLHTNILHWRDTRHGYHARTGVEVLFSVCHASFEELDPRVVIICGGGFTDSPESYGLYQFGDNSTLGQIAQSLCSGVEIFGPEPGQRIELRRDKPCQKNFVDWIQLDNQRIKVLKARQTNFLNSATKKLDDRPVLICPPFLDIPERRAAQERVQADLVEFAKVVLSSQLGRHALEWHTYNGLELGPSRIVLQIFDYEGLEDICQYALNFSSGRFEKLHSQVDAVSNFPFGMNIHLRDYSGMLTGELQIWDLVAGGILSWYAGPFKYSFVPVLFTYFGESAMPLAFERLLQSASDRLKPQWSGSPEQGQVASPTSFQI